MTGVCKHITFSKSNYVPESEITATPEPNTRIDFLKDEWPARQAVWRDETQPGDVVIEGTFGGKRGIEYMALPGFNFGEYTGVDVKFELFETEASTTDILNLPAASIGSAKPIGLYEFGIDPWADGAHPPINNTYAHFFEQVYQAEKWRVTLSHDITPTGDQMQIPTQDNAGQIVMNANNPAIFVENENANDRWDLVNDSFVNDTHSNGAQALRKVGGFHSSAQEGPRVVFPFKANQSGAYRAWGLFKSGVAGADSIYTIHDGVGRLTTMPPLNVNNWSWHEIREITLTEGRVYHFEICGRDPELIFDRLVIRPASLGTPGVAGNESTTITTYDDDANIAARMIMMGRSLTLDKNFSYGTNLKRFTPPNLYQTESGFYVPQNNQSKIRRLDLSLPSMFGNDRFEMAMLEERAIGSPFIVSAYPNRDEFFSGDYLMLGRFANELDFGHESYDRHNTQLTIFEA